MVAGELDDDDCKMLAREFGDWGIEKAVEDLSNEDAQEAVAGVDGDVEMAAGELGNDVELVVLVIVADNEDDEMVAEESEEDDDVEIVVVCVVIDDNAEMEDD
jgi:hypothetical protein